MPRVFCSYTSRYKAQVGLILDEIESALEDDTKLELSDWIDDEFPPGSGITKEVKERLDGCNVFIAFICSRYRKVYGDFELEYWIKNGAETGLTIPVIFGDRNRGYWEEKSRGTVLEGDGGPKMRVELDPKDLTATIGDSSNEILRQPVRTKAAEIATSISRFVHGLQKTENSPRVGCVALEAGDELKPESLFLLGDSIAEEGEGIDHACDSLVQALDLTSLSILTTGEDGNPAAAHGWNTFWCDRLELALKRRGDQSNHAIWLVGKQESQKLLKAGPRLEPFMGKISSEIDQKLERLCDKAKAKNIAWFFDLPDGPPAEFSSLPKTIPFQLAFGPSVEKVAKLLGQGMTTIPRVLFEVSDAVPSEYQEWYDTSLPRKIIPSKNGGDALYADMFQDGDTLRGFLGEATGTRPIVVGATDKTTDTSVICGDNSAFNLHIRKRLKSWDSEIVKGCKKSANLRPDMVFKIVFSFSERPLSDKFSGISGTLPWIRLPVHRDEQNRLIVDEGRLERIRQTYQDIFNGAC